MADDDGNEKVDGVFFSFDGESFCTFFIDFENFFSTVGNHGKKFDDHEQK